MVPETVNHFIGGRHVRSALGKTYGVADPATGKEYAQVAVGIAGDVNQAVLAAGDALEAGPWPKMAAATRARPARRRARWWRGTTRWPCSADTPYYITQWQGGRLVQVQPLASGVTLDVPAAGLG